MFPENMKKQSGVKYCAVAHGMCLPVLTRENRFNKDMQMCKKSAYSGPLQSQVGKGARNSVCRLGSEWSRPRPGAQCSAIRESTSGGQGSALKARDDIQREGEDWNFSKGKEAHFPSLFPFMPFW